MAFMKKSPKSIYYTRPGALSGLEQFAGSINQALRPMLDRFGLSSQLLEDPNAVVSYAAVCALLEACALEWNCPDLGIRLGRMQSLDFLGPVGLVARLTDTVNEAIHAVRLNMAIHSNAFHSEIELDVQEGGSDKLARITYAPKPDAGCGSQMVELSLCRAYQFLSITSGMKKLKVRYVTMRHPAAQSATLATRFFGRKVIYQHACNAIYFDPEILKAPTAVRDASLSSLVHAYLEQARQQTESDMVDVTRRLIAQLLSTGRCTREAVSALLHMHPRTLQRRLLDQGTTFADVLDTYRRTKAAEWVSQRNIPLVQLSQMLGYANQSAFSSAYRRWHGASPTSVRSLERS